MKVKIVSRDEADYSRERSFDISKSFKNPDPVLHPFEKAIEYTRAMNAVKLQRIFARPFLHSFAGHSDGIHCLRWVHAVQSRTRSFADDLLVSGSCDGEIRLWNLRDYSCRRTIPNAHQGFVRGLAIFPIHSSSEECRVLSCGSDGRICLWLPFASDGTGSYSSSSSAAASLSSLSAPTATSSLGGILARSWSSESAFHCISSPYHASGAFASHSGAEQYFFGTGGTGGIHIWSDHRNEPVQQHLRTADDAIICMQFSPSESSLICAGSSDRSLVLLDLRAKSVLHRNVMAMKPNKVCWNPQAPLNFLVANEDSRCYTFDMRRLDRASCVHEDHVGPVLDVEYSPTGREFVSGSYDRTVRLFRSNAGHSHEVYHTSRMQRVFCVAWSPDNQFVLSGSDDTNIRLWKAVAWNRTDRNASSKEREAHEYREQLVSRYQHLPEIQRIQRHRHTPKAIHSAKAIRREMKQAERRRIDNARANSRTKRTEKLPSEREKHVLRDMD